jgi:hypothetical protein
MIDTLAAVSNLVPILIGLGVVVVLVAALAVAGLSGKFARHARDEAGLATWEPTMEMLAERYVRGGMTKDEFRRACRAHRRRLAMEAEMAATAADAKTQRISRPRHAPAPALREAGAPAAPSASGSRRRAATPAACADGRCSVTPAGSKGPVGVAVSALDVRSPSFRAGAADARRARRFT